MTISRSSSWMNEWEREIDKETKNDDDDDDEKEARDDDIHAFFQFTKI